MRGGGEGETQLETCTVKTVYKENKRDSFAVSKTNKTKLVFLHTPKVTLTTTTNGGIRGAPLM